uniref:ATP synthase subunit b', chloroplastic n=1 Tax=Taenioma perpusillum TaxID=210852 RepID=A0A1Z1MRV4_9FLOR|nr:ATP synthase CF0 subunit II [Taenioma perpusillum]ARW68495.1 ATP synthase CF0 subunit II [Taenioma perpusillum]
MYYLLLSFILNISTEETTGGLFDFNATLPLMALQFIVLTVILNVIFYNPVSNVLDEREEYIRNSLTTASTSLLKAEELTQKYENELANSRKKAQNIIKTAQNDAQMQVSQQIQDAQKETESLLKDIYGQLNTQKNQALKTLETKIDILSDQITSKLLDY